MTETADKLEQAFLVYKTGLLAHRDCLLKTGRLLHEYILESLLAKDHLPRDKRNLLKVSRQNLVKQCCQKLELPDYRINIMLNCWMVVELLGEGNELGEIGFNSISLFGRFVRRRTGDSKHKVCPYSLLETWEIRQGYEQVAKDLFARAVREGMAWEQIKEELQKPGYPVPYAGPRTKRSTVHMPPSMEELHADPVRKRSAAKKASSGDVAEMCMELVDAAEYPLEVAVKLQAMLQNRFQQRKAM